MFCGAGVSPAVLPPKVARKTAGKMPAPRKAAFFAGVYFAGV
jgi:hypothetical protein